MSARNDLELTIRTATIIKSISALIGVSDMRLARIMLMEAAKQVMDPSEFIDKCNAPGKAKSEDG